MALLSPWVIPLVFGAQFRPSVPVIWWILPGTVALAVGKVMAADLTARGRPEYSSIFAIMALGVTVVLDLVLIPRMGIEGAALASSAAYFLDALLLAMALKRVLQVRWVTLLLPSTSDAALYYQVWQRFRGLAAA